MNAAQFCEKLRRREPTVGTWVQIDHPTSPEILGSAGYDWVGADLEHSDIDTVSFAALLRGLHGRPAVGLARVSRNDPLEIRRVLDLGAAGVIVPLVNDAAQAAAAVQAAKYPPVGVRGFCFGRMNGWGENFAAYAAQANAETAVIVMIESKAAVENIDAILAVPGVDAVFIGPYDLSGSYGIPGQTDAPQIKQACARVVAACAAAGKAAGLHLVHATPEAIRQTLQSGFTLICLGADIIFLRETATRLAREAAAVLKESVLA